jgi:hypothetical protein
MLMVVFGAGASYGSRPERGPLAVPMPKEPVRPPLTNELLSGRHGAFAARYPSSKPAIVALRRALSEDPDCPIESAIGDLYEAAAGNPERARHLLALRFYLCDLIETVSNEWWDQFHGFTHYTELLDRIGARLWRTRGRLGWRSAPAPCRRSARCGARAGGRSAALRRRSLTCAR